MSRTRTVITGLGMASALGGAATAAAAVRAGITRPRPLAAAPLAGTGPEPEALSGHPAEGLTDGYYFTGRWCRLAHAALQDLAGYAGLPAARETRFWERTGLVVAIPDFIEERYLTKAIVDDDYLLRSYVMKVVRLLGWPLAPASVQLVRRGQAGVVDGLRRARADLTAGTFDRAIVLGADSFVESTSLRWLGERGRLRTPDRATGTIPGEAAACCLVESEAIARARQTRVEAVLESAVVASERNFDREGGRGLGLALGRACEEALRASGAALPYDGDLVCDLNGTDGAALDYGTMLTRLVSRVVSPSAPLRSACVQLGETGAASAAISVCVAVRSLARGYARSPTVVVTARGDDGDVGAACFSGAGREGVAHASAPAGSPA